MLLFYDSRDDRSHEERGSQILYWLDDMGARPLDEARPADEGFLFAGARSIEDYRSLVADRPMLRDRPEEREPLLLLHRVLDALRGAQVPVPTARTWYLPLDCELPSDLKFPLFVRTSETSFKVGGNIHRVATPRELEQEAALLRRALRWDALILAREWLELAVAGNGIYGPIPQEVRVWIVDGAPFAWSFHYLNVLKQPAGFPPSPDALRRLAGLAKNVASVFRSRLIVADFAKLQTGDWYFIEAGPGSCAGTAHEKVFKAVAGRLMGESQPLAADSVGGPLMST